MALRALAFSSKLVVVVIMQNTLEIDRDNYSLRIRARDIRFDFIDGSLIFINRINLKWSASKLTNLAPYNNITNAQFDEFRFLTFEGDLIFLLKGSKTPQFIFSESILNGGKDKILTLPFNGQILVGDYSIEDADPAPIFVEVPKEVSNSPEPLTPIPPNLSIIGASLRQLQVASDSGDQLLLLELSFRQNLLSGLRTSLEFEFEGSAVYGTNFRFYETQSNNNNSSGVFSVEFQPNTLALKIQIEVLGGLNKTVGVRLLNAKNNTCEIPISLNSSILPYTITKALKSILQFSSLEFLATNNNRNSYTAKVLIVRSQSADGIVVDAELLIQKSTPLIMPFSLQDCQSEIEIELEFTAEDLDPNLLELDIFLQNGTNSNFSLGELSSSKITIPST